MRNTFLPFSPPLIGDEEIAEVLDTLRSDWITTGPKVKRFEQEFAEFIGAPAALAVSSATDAMQVALAALGIGPGDEVITTTMTFCSTVHVIEHVGARPVLVDVLPDTLTLDPARVAEALTPRTRAFLPVHLYGHPCEMDALLELAQQHHLAIVEDAAHALPARYKGRLIGASLSDQHPAANNQLPVTSNQQPASSNQLPATSSQLPATSNQLPASSNQLPATSNQPPATSIQQPVSSNQHPATSLQPPASSIQQSATCFSFYATKNLTTAEGGMVTGEADLIDRARIWSLHGMSRDAWKRYGTVGSWYYEVVLPGFKCNMTDIQAALGLQQLHKLPQFQQRRREIVRQYQAAFAAMPELQTPTERPEAESAWHIYALRLNLEQLRIDRAQFIQELTARNIGTSVHFIPNHLQPYYRDKYGYRAEDFPVAYREYQRLISLPLNLRLSDADVEDVIEAVKDIVEVFKR